MTKEKKSFEAVLSRLEEIVEKMESGGLSLEESMALYEEGIKKAETLNSMLSEARDSVMKLVADKNGAASLDLFEGIE
ncbi:MAG: exodeoxyribonuclease VII small subunit [Candidatus Latescibacteria bacterium]|jgi:exodeoxyribonuclease VII small subunit|nr:exodeoxyribonuclease VII small subunit [Candidatus Latescibacterota bacterium]